MMAKSKNNTSVILEGRGVVSLNSQDYVATGGEGSIYRKNDTVIKIYADQNKMLRDGMLDKIMLLKTCQHKFIVTPENIVRDTAQKPIGYYMKFVDGEPLSRFFTNDYRMQAQFSDQDANILVDHMRTAIEYAHSKHAILVDANELNWLVSEKKKHAPEPQIVDVDSWAIGKWKSQVIMPSIRDWHAQTFNEMSDWFSWGIVTFQIYTGIHPYRGKLDGYKQQELERRMRENASVFRKGVRLNRAVRDFSCIPVVLRQWYEDVFSSGKRSVPPSPFDVGKIVPTIARTVHITSSAPEKRLLIFEKLFKRTQRVQKIFSAGVVLLENGELVELTKGRKICQASTSKIVVTTQDDGWLIVECENGKVTCQYIDYATLNVEHLSINLFACGVISSQSRIFIIGEKGLTELVMMKLGKKVLLSVGNTWSVLPHATKWFSGFGVEDVMGAKQLIVPFGDRACATIRVKELDGLSVINGCAGVRFISLIAVDQKGLYHKHEYSFDDAYQHYDLWQDCVDNAELAIAILPKGVCATIVTDGVLDIFVPTTGVKQKVSDALIRTGTHLEQWDGTVIYSDQETVWRVRMK